jgi:glycosyltransferase involved in cell wall biosynthesis
VIANIDTIMPVYNVQDYLVKCISSVINQVYPRFCIFAIDDGSYDNSCKICDDYSLVDSRICSIHKVNGGQSRARNVGIRISDCDFISFIDSDDYISENMYKSMIGEFHDSVDIVECSYKEVDCNDDNLNFQYYNSDNKIKLTGEKALESNILKKSICYTIVWNKLYRRETYQGLEFPEGVLCEDTHWAYQTFDKLRHIIVLEKCLYAYRQRSTSTMHASTFAFRLSAVKAACDRQALIRDKYPSLIKIGYYDIWKTCIYIAQLMLKYSPTEFFAYKDYFVVAIKKYKADYNIYSIIKYQWILMSFISITLTCWLRNLLEVGF